MVYTIMHEATNGNTLLYNTSSLCKHFVELNSYRKIAECTTNLETI